MNGAPNLSQIQQYKEQSIQTMTKGELLVLLFDEILKNMSIANVMIEQENWATFEKCTQKCIAVFDYLSNILDRKYELSTQLYNMYSFMKQEVIRAEIKRKKGILEPLIPLVEDMRQTWIEAEKLTKMGKN